MYVDSSVQAPAYVFSSAIGMCLSWMQNIYLYIYINRLYYLYNYITTNLQPFSLYFGHNRAELCSVFQ